MGLNGGLWIAEGFWDSLSDLLWFDLLTHEPGGVPPLSGLSLEWSQMYTESLHNEGTKTVRDTRLVLYSPVVRVLRL